MLKKYFILLAVLLFPLQSYASDFPAKEVYIKSSQAVVVIKASRNNGGGMISSGAIISGDGLVITNAHSVIDKEENSPYQKIVVFIKPSKVFAAKDDLDKYYEAEVLSFDTPLDLAVLKLKGFDQKAGILEFADPKDIGIGEEVIAIGHPEQGGFWTLTYGRISAEHRDYKGVSGKDMYQTDTSVNRGNSGGPLLDRRGYIVAVNSNIARLSKDGLAITGINYSIKSSVVLKWLNDNGYKVAYGQRPLEDTRVAKTGVTDAKPQDVKPEGKEALDKPVPETKPVSARNEQKLIEKRFETPRKPYDWDGFLKAAEKDLEDMMGEMRGKTRR